MVRLLVGLVTFAFLGWSGYWWVGSTAHDTAMRSWLDGRQQAGWVADYKTLDVRGYPSRFDTTITDLHLADPESGWAWAVPEFFIHGLSYQPNHIIAVWPENQTLSSTRETIRIHTTNMRSSVKFEADTKLALDSMVLEIDDMTLNSTKGWVSTMKQARFATKQSTAEDFAHVVDFEATDVKPADLFKSVIDPSGLLPDVFDRLHIGATLAFDAPLDRLALEGATPQLTRLDLTDLTANWGELELQAKGSVDLDSQGYPTGKIRIRAHNWQKMLQVGTSSGAIPADVAKTLKTALGFIAKLSGNANTIDAPLSFSKRVMYVGPLPVGPAPRFSY